MSICWYYCWQLFAPYPARELCISMVCYGSCKAHCPSSDLAMDLIGHWMSAEMTVCSFQSKAKKACSCFVISAWRTAYPRGDAPLARTPKGRLMGKSHLEQSPSPSCSHSQPAAICGSVSPSTQDRQWGKEINLCWYLPLRFRGCFVSLIWLLNTTNKLWCTHPKNGETRYLCSRERGKEMNVLEHLL